MNKIKHFINIIEISNETEEKTNNHKKNKKNKKNKSNPDPNEFLFFPLMDIETKFKLSNKFDKKHSEKFLEEKDKCLGAVELDDKLPEEIGEGPFYKISNIDLLNFTFGK